MPQGDIPHLLIYVIPGFILLMLVEALSYRFAPRANEAGYTAKDTATSLAMGAGCLLADSLWNVPLAAVLVFLSEATPVHWEPVWWTWPLVLLVQDLTCYWQHRCHHAVRILWASHVVHHSSRQFNFSTALRQTWTAVAVNFFYLPMIVLGVPLRMLIACGALSLVYQFWIHTERIGRLPRPVEFVLNTPSHHRVHHASNGRYLDRNFGCILIVWDRLFGTFEPETEPCVYGLTKNIDTFNPVRVAFHEYAALARDLHAAQDWRTRTSYLLRGPGFGRSEHLSELRSIHEVPTAATSSPKHGFPANAPKLLTRPDSRNRGAGSRQ
ncbi:sterol desaturase family protein [Nannocystis pusilla]|uniref:sterol desaturase family protein n=1 Tax=Nannocystis pusilla TaxID=889268 RepID=UPI003B78EBA1